MTDHPCDHPCDRHPPATLSCWVNCACRCRPCCLEASDYHRDAYRGVLRNVPVDELQPLLADLYAAGWTQAQVARAMGVKRQIVSRIQHGRCATFRRPTASALRSVHESLEHVVSRVTAGPLLAAVQSYADARGGLVVVLDEADRRTFYRSADRGWVDEKWADRIACTVLGMPLELIYGSDLLTEGAA